MKLVFLSLPPVIGVRWLLRERGGFCLVAFPPLGRSLASCLCGAMQVVFDQHASMPVFQPRVLLDGADDRHRSRQIYAVCLPQAFFLCHLRAWTCSVLFARGGRFGLLNYGGH